MNNTRRSLRIVSGPSEERLATTLRREPMNEADEEVKDERGAVRRHGETEWCGC